MDDIIALNLGAPWPEDYFSLPPDELSFGFHLSGLSPFLVIGDPRGEIAEEAMATSTIRLGFAQFGPLVICMMKSSALPVTMLESPRPFIVGDPAPEVTVEDGDHMLWMLVTVSRGIILNMRAFTTSPRITVFLRRAFAEQRAHGPISYEQSDAWIRQWQAECPTDREAWKRVVVSCLAGD